ncbi:phosphotransferase [Actinomadura sp. 3N407]|uniref:phosphotransferase n=1 Tax=Actinomadura sp. 3N407 TaxID=3457423 RepID=UPI003FCC5DFD
MLDPNDRFLTCREILRWHYGHRRPEFLGAPRRHYSLHYTYRQGDRLYVASKVRKERGRIPFSRQFAIMRALERTDAGCVVRSPVATKRRRGRDWVTGPSNRWFVRSYTEHDRTPDWLSKPLVTDAARKLALVHRTASAIDPGVLRAPTSGLQVYDWGMSSVLEGIDALVDDMASRGRTHDHVTAVEAGMTRLRAERPGLDLGPKGLTHHDLRTENLLVRNGEVVEIVDWDRAHWDVQWYDVTLTALHLAYVQPANLRWDLTQAFLDAYQVESGASLTADARAWLLRFTAVRNLAVSRSPGKWARLMQGVNERWGSVASAFVDDFVAEDEVTSHLDVAAEDGGALGAVGAV